MSTHAPASGKDSSAASVPTSVAVNKSQPLTISTHGGSLLQRKCACGSTTASLTGECGECKSNKLLQTKLTVGASNDPFEQEADRVADQVLAARPNPAVKAAPPQIQRFTGQPNASVVTAAPASVDRVLSSPGSPLEPALRQDMEQRFNHDFSRVRIHADAKAAESARAVNALAYTVGHHIVFAEGQYHTGDEQGRKLLGHELTHTVQQSALASTSVPPSQPISLERPGTSLEHAVEDRTTLHTNRSRALAPIQGIALQRQPAPSARTEKAEEAGGEPLFTILVADESKRRDKRFARKQAIADSARISKSGPLSGEDRRLVNAKLSFFEGEAKEVYGGQMKTALRLAIIPEIEMPAMYVGRLPDAEPTERARIRRRRELTARFFNKIKDHQLESAYSSRLQRYLDEGMEANDYVDVEMIEQIIAERAPNAPWHEGARQHFLSQRDEKLRLQEKEKRLTPYWKGQFHSLAEQMKMWPAAIQTYAQANDIQTYARDLLWKWNDRVSIYEDNPPSRVFQSAVAARMTFKDIVDHYEGVVRMKDRAIQQECRLNPPSTLMKVWGDPCKPWFEGSSQRGEEELRQLQRRMLIYGGKGGGDPYRNIVDWLEQFIKGAQGLPTQMGNVHLEILQSWATVQGGLTMANVPVKTPRIDVHPPPAALASRGQPALPPGGTRPRVGDIISPGAEVGLGPQRVTAVLAEGELLTPVTRMPAANRALPPPRTPAVGPVVKAPPATVSTSTVPIPKVSQLPAPKVSQLPAPRLPAPLVPKLVLAPPIVKPVSGPGYWAAEGEVIGQVPSAKLPTAPATSAPYGTAMEPEMAITVQERFPHTKFRLNTGQGGTGPDLVWIGGENPGFHIGEFKPSSQSGVSRFVTQVRRLWSGGPKAPPNAPFKAALIVYEADGTIWIGSVSTVGK